MRHYFVILSFCAFTFGCGETRRPVAIDTQSNDSTVKTEKNSADLYPSQRRGFAFINPITGLEIPDSIAVPPGAAVKVGFKMVGVSADSFSVGYARGSSRLFQIQSDRIILSQNLPEGVHEFQIVGRNTRSCSQVQRASSVSNEQNSGSSGLRCNIQGVEVPSLNFDFDISTTLRVTASSSAVVAAINSPRSGTAASSDDSTSAKSTDGDLDNRINSQFGLQGDEIEH